MRREYIKCIHADLGHFGQAKTCEAVARHAYFPGWCPYTKLIVRKCTVCNKSHRGGRMPRQTALRPMHEFRPMSVLHVDLVGPIPVGSNGKGQYGFQYILSVIDSATRYLWLILLQNKTAETVTNALYEDVIARTSVPSAVLTDLGKEFTAEILGRLYARLGTTRLCTSGYHPQCDSKCERVHCSVHDMLVKFIERNYRNWAAYLPGIYLAYNFSIHTATGYAPHELFYSLPPTCPFDAVVEAEQTEAVSNADQYALEATDRLKQAFQFVYEYSGHVADRMKSNYDAAIKPRHFDVGSFVLVYTPPKQQSHVYGKWKVAYQGPFRVKKRLNATNYIVKWSHKAKDFIVHGDHLRDYHGEIDSTAWPPAKGNSQQSAASGPDTATGDPDPASQVDDRTHNTAPAQPPPAQSDSNLTGGRRPRRNPASQTSGHLASNTGVSPGIPVSMSPDIHYVNERHFEPIGDAGIPTRPTRDHRRPARYLTAISVSDVAADGEDGRRHLGNTVNCRNKQLSCEELLDYTDINCIETLSVDSDRRMRDKRQRKDKRRHRSSDSLDSESNCHGRRRPRQQQPRVPFEPRYCGQCAPADRRTRYATRSSLTKHSVLQHGTWYHPGRDEYVAIPEERLAVMRARYRAWRSHRTKATRRRQPRSGCRAKATMTTRDRTPSPPPSTPGACLRVSVEPEEPSMPPVTTTRHWQRPTPVLSTVRARLRSGTGVGRGYGILQCAAERDPSPPASRSRPPLSSTDSDDDLSDVTVIDIGCASDGHGDGQSGNRHRDLPTSRSTSGRRTTHTSRVPGTCPLSG